MVICMERCADLHMAQLMALPLTVSCFSKIQIGFSFLVPAHLDSPGQRVCVIDQFYKLQSLIKIRSLFPKRNTSNTVIDWTHTADRLLYLDH